MSKTKYFLNKNENGAISSDIKYALNIKEAQIPNFQSL